MRTVLSGLIVATLMGATSDVRADLQISDLRLGYTFMRISEVTAGGITTTPTFLRHQLAFAVGIDAFSLGLTYQRATKTAATDEGTPEDGLMLTVGYDRLLVDGLRLESLARVAVSSGTDSTQPLYATDTDLSLKLVVFDAAGWGSIHNPIFPTAAFGGIVNRFGRVQLTGGVGLWWWGFSTFVSGLYALNGVDDPNEVGPDERATFAALQNTSVTVSVAYDVDVSTTTQLHLEARKNFGFENAGNDLVGVVQLRLFFDEIHDDDDDAFEAYDFEEAQ